MYKLFIPTILLFYLLFIGVNWRVQENGQELFFIFIFILVKWTVKENGYGQFDLLFVFKCLRLGRIGTHIHIIIKSITRAENRLVIFNWPSTY